MAKEAKRQQQEWILVWDSTRWNQFRFCVVLGVGAWEVGLLPMDAGIVAIQ